MRDIKFRAWVDNKMYYQDRGNLIRKLIIEPKVGFNAYHIRLNHKENDKDFKIFLDNIMQFTGLKDKNGKEIYEGDIIKRMFGDIEVVEYSYGMYNVSLISGIGNKECEVIGNIWENPELLRGDEEC